ncbi:MAG TPA: glycosyltransferase [Patescibacteria group bacterium]
MKKRGQKKPETLFLSVIIPAYKAEKIIQKSLKRVKDVLDDTRYPYEIICVVDGRVDGTFEKAEKLAKRYRRKIKVVGYDNNLGKGHAVKYGMAQSKGDIIGFIDAGFDINPNSLSLLLEHFEWYRADIIVGSKRHPVSKVVYPWQRRILSFGYQIFVRVLFGLNIKDTQVGLKFFRRKVLEKTLPRLLVKAWAFDVEMLAVANYLGFKRIYEAPIELKMEFGGASVLTSKGFLRTVFWMFWDTLAIFYRLRIKRYYRSDNKSIWITPHYLTFKGR